jgi:hypothetical protein
MDIQTFVQKQPHLGFALILQLTGVNGSQQFDKLTKSKTVESILASMDADGIKNYINHLVAQVSPATDGERFRIFINPLGPPADNELVRISRSLIREGRGLLISFLR